MAELSSALPGAFSSVVEAILGLSGRVILSGMGKSGHVARKIASTLASTGTPAYFVHPAEASHGDLGMVTPDDFCILLSNSGETTELRPLVAHTRRFAIPLAGISKNENSALMAASDFRLTIPPLPEACSIGLAPTTSTILMLGMGDALAVALMEAREFQEYQFRDFHPGGTLGAQLVPVSQVMYRHEKIPLVDQDAPMGDAILVMSSRGFGVTGVIDEKGNLVGVISDGDLRRNMDGLLMRKASDVCSQSPVMVEPSTLAAQALMMMNQAKVGALFVCEGDKPVGVLHLHDLLRIGVT